MEYTHEIRRFSIVILSVSEGSKYRFFGLRPQNDIESKSMKN